MTDGPEPKDSQLDGARSIAYGLLANAFRYPDRELVDTLLDPQRWSDWPALIRRIDATAAEELEAVRDRWVEAKGRRTADGDDDFQGAYVRLFGHAVRGACPLYELEYGHGEIIQQSSILADITGFYTAFGMELVSGGNERPDHVSVECEFMSILAAKEAHAMSHEEDAEAHGTLNEAQRAFLEDHLAKWLPSLGRRITEAQPQGFYGGIARFAEAFVLSECRRLDAVGGSRLLELRPPDPTRDATIDCGTESCAGGAQPSSLVQVGLDSSLKSG